MSMAAADQDSRFDLPTLDPAETDCGALGVLPHLSRSQVQLAERLGRVATGESLLAGVLGIDASLGRDIATGPVEVLWRPSGIRRPSLVAQMSWPRLATRLALGIETPVAHALVDRLLGFDRLDVEGRLQLTPVEWGVLTFLIARRLAALGERNSPLGAWDWSLDRVSPDPFDGRGLGNLVTLRWPVAIGPVAGSLRAWLPESLVARWLACEPLTTTPLEPGALARVGSLTGVWRAQAAIVDMPRGLGKLRIGGVLPLVGSRLRGTPQSPSGRVELIAVLSSRGGRCWFPAEAAPLSGGGRLVLSRPLQRDPTPREPIAVNPPSETASSGPAAGSPAPNDVPVTLVVELGRVNLPLSRLADLKPGDVVELGRHSREPVELTSGGRLVARGELVQIDTELGVRVTNVFL